MHAHVLTIRICNKFQYLRGVIDLKNSSKSDTPKKWCGPESKYYWFEYAHADITIRHLECCNGNTDPRLIE